MPSSNTVPRAGRTTPTTTEAWPAGRLCQEASGSRTRPRGLLYAPPIRGQ